MKLQHRELDELPLEVRQLEIWETVAVTLHEILEELKKLNTTHIQGEL